MSASFVVFESTPAAVAPPGPWQPYLTAGSFVAGEQAEMVWQARLPADLVAAQIALQQATAQLLAHEAALATVEQRLQRAITGAVSFGPTLPQAEQTLLNLIARAQSMPDGVSFGLGDEIQSRWQAAQEQIIAFGAQAREALSAYATVETMQEGQLIGRTRINWHGDARSILRARIDPTQIALHQRTLALALRSRAGLIRMIGLVGRGAAIVAAMLTAPAGAVLALPAVWQFVQEILAEGRQSVNYRAPEGGGLPSSPATGDRASGPVDSGPLSRSAG